MLTIKLSTIAGPLLHCLCKIAMPSTIEACWPLLILTGELIVTLVKTALRASDACTSFSCYFSLLFSGQGTQPCRPAQHLKRCREKVTARLKEIARLAHRLTHSLWKSSHCSRSAEALSEPFFFCGSSALIPPLVFFLTSLSPHTL